MPLRTVSTELAGEDGGTLITLSQHAGGVRLVFSDTGTFDISPDGRRIVWYPSADPSMDLVRNDLMGRVLAVASHRAGLLILHASAVLAADGVIGLIASKGAGKSTLALSLVARGGRLVSDDLLPIVPGPPAVARPGVHVMRAHDDTTAYLGQAVRSGARALGGKQLLALDGPDLCHDVPAPLAALYELRPVVGGERDARLPVRRPLNGVMGAMRMIRHSKLGPLLAGDFAGEALDRAARVAEAVSVYTLELPRGFELLDDASDTILSWHGGPVARRLPAANPS